VKSKYVTYLNIVCSAAFTVIFLEWVSWLTLVSLGIALRPYPWSVFSVIREGFFLEPFLCFISVMVSISLFYAWVLGGVRRVFASYLTVALLGVVTSSMLGLLIHMRLENLTGMSVAYVMERLRMLHQDTLVRDHFLYSQWGCFSLLVMVSAWTFFNKIRPANKALGDAHFSSGLELQRAGFFKQEQESIVIGKKYGVPLYANGFEHVLVFAPSGSGKTRSIAIPNLFNYPYSMVCNDVKLTLFETTSKYRERILGHQCYCFAPARIDSITHRYNPLTFISDNPLQRMTDIQRIAHIFIPDNPKDSFWAQTGRKLFKALVLFLLDTPTHPTTLGEINRLIKQHDFNWWLQSTLDDTEHYDPEFYRNGYSYINNDGRTRDNILESFSGHFELFDDPVIDAATSASDFDFGDLRRKKMTIYVGFTDEDMERLSPLLTLFWQQLMSRMIQSIPNIKEEPFPVLCLIDEFSSLGRIERLRRSLKLLREYRVRCILMFQYIAQTYEKYSHDEAQAFMNIKTKVAYTTEDLNDAEFISKMLGTRTQRVVSHSRSNQQQGTNHSKSISYQAIPLLRHDEVSKLSPKVALIMRSGHAPIKAKQYIWHNEPVMKHLSEGASELPTQKVRVVPFDHAAKKVTAKEKTPKKTKSKLRSEDTVEI